MTETNTDMIDQLEETKKFLEAEMKTLSKSINDQMSSTNNLSKEMLDGLIKKLNDTINVLKTDLDQSGYLDWMASNSAGSRRKISSRSGSNWVPRPSSMASMVSS